MSSRRSNRQGGFGLILLASEIMRIGPDRIPPVTLITVIFNVVIYMGLLPFLPSVHGACTSNHYVLKKREWMRLLYSSFYHLDDMHLYYNMVSFIWKGLKLEREMKTLKFSIVIVLFSVLTQLVMLIFNRIFAEVFLNPQYLNTCAAGFSAVIFALKVLTTASSDNSVHVMGMPLPVPARYACWVELILIHLLVPNSSFTGHLSGIIVGLLYTRGPLRKVVKVMKKLIAGNYVPNIPRQSYTYTATSSGRRSSDENEEIQRAIQESLQYRNFQDNRNGYRNEPPPPYGWNIPDESVVPPQNRMYPNLPPGGERSNFNAVPSAPSYDNTVNSNSKDPPYPTTGIHLNSPHNIYPPPIINSHASSGPVRSDDHSTDEYSHDSVRAARLRKFGKKLN